MPSFIRLPPSGPVSSVGSAQGSNSIINTSSVPGATFTDALDAIDTAVTELETVTVSDDFLGGADTNTGSPDNGRFGQLGWSFESSGAGTLSRPTDQEYMGAYALNSPPSTISAFMYADDTGQDAIDFPSSLFTFLDFLICPNIGDSISGGSFRAGLGIDGELTNFGATALFIEVARAVSNNWRMVTRVGSINTVITSTIPFAPHQLTRVRLARNLVTGAWTGSINGFVIGTFLSGVSGTRMKSGIQVESAAGSAQSMSIDRYAMGMRASLF